MALERLPAGRHDRLGAYCFDTATPIVAGTADGGAGGGRHRADRRRPRAGRTRRSPTACAGRPATTPGATSSAAIASSTTPPSWRSRCVDRGAQRVAILDVDFHHGNGTQQIFWERGDVLYVSLHGDPAGIYPYYSGYATERGAGAGEGATLNLPLPPGTDGDAYLAALDEALAAIRDFDPDAPARRVARVRHVPHRPDLQPRAPDR